MNLANKITIFRVFLVPLFMIVLYSNLQYSTYIAAIIFIFASFAAFLYSVKDICCSPFK